jgi:predicted ribosomally synthesized peptide with SipW-like signal peptide
MKKAGIFILIGVLALGAIGIGYAAWSQNLTISGSVKTGNYDVYLQDIVTPAAPNSTVKVTNTIDGTAAKSHTITVKVENAYPNFTDNVTFKVNNNSSVPISITPTISTFDISDYSVTLTGFPTSSMAANTLSGVCSLYITVKDGASPAGAGPANFSFSYDTAQAP